MVGDQTAVDATGRIGRTLAGRWRLESVVGIGGMATVYAAAHRTGARVAIKILHRRFSGDRDVCKRFRREAYLANAVGHPSVVAVSDDDADEDGTPFFVMELLQGESVEALRRRSGGVLSVAAAEMIALRTLDVLRAAHEKGIVHRDLKPSNLFMTQAGEVKVLDFGIAACASPLSAESAATHPGTLLGTPGFMAPEQARARWSEVGPRTDLFALGATLFKLLSGVEVHPGETTSEQLGAAMTASPRSLASVAPHLPTSLIAIVDRALAYDSSERYPSAEAMRDALLARDTAFEGITRSSPARETHADSRAPKWGLAQFFAAGAVLGLALALVLAARSAPRAQAAGRSLSAPETARRVVSAAPPARTGSAGSSAHALPEPGPFSLHPAPPAHTVRAPRLRDTGPASQRSTPATPVSAPAAGSETPPTPNEQPSPAPSPPTNPPRTPIDPLDRRL